MDPLTAPSSAAQTPWPTKTWPVATPAAVGLDPKILAAFDADLAAGTYGYVDSMLVIRHGKIACERAYPHDYGVIYAQEARTPSALNAHDPAGPYNYFNSWWHPFHRRGELHTLQSVTKTITSILIGVASARREFPSLDTPLLEFFNGAQLAHVDDRKRRVTLRHLLTMTAGFAWNEDLPFADPDNAACRMEASFDWVQFAIDRPMSQEPGQGFQYNSGAAQLLSHVFRAATGRDIEEYAVQHLFTPLGIRSHFWKRTPTGLADTEGGLYLEPRDVAKIAYLVLRGGEWEGKPIISAEWVQASLTASAMVSDDGVKYGYLWWLYPYGKYGRVAVGGAGFGGQHMILVPEQDLVLVFTGWNVLPESQSLSAEAAIDRVLAAVVNGSNLAS
ncbi:MAG: serine hydrolase [Candidatus Delongbacteria bacterium]